MVESAKPEWSLLVRAERIADAPRQLVADAAACQALAKRFEIVDIASLSAELDYSRRDDGVAVTGVLRADIVQQCVITLEPFSSRVEEAIGLVFVPEAALLKAESAADSDGEFALSDTDCDMIGYAGQNFDIAEAMAQTLALALDPFPRGPDADHVVVQSGIVQQCEAARLDEDHPFSALKSLTSGSEE